MRIGFVSTYPPIQCGIATYTQAIVNELARLDGADVLVLSEDGGKPEPEIEVIEAFSRNDANYSKRLIESLNKNRLDILHIQHAPDIFGMGVDLLNTIRAAKSNGTKVVLTMHTVFDLLSGAMERKPYAPLTHFMLGRLADRIVVHQGSILHTLKRHGVPQEKLVEIPHWTGTKLTGDAEPIRTRLNLPSNAKVLLFFGFIHIQKNVAVAVRALAKLLKQRSDVYLVIAGSIAGNKWYNKLYATYLRTLAAQLGIEAHTRMVDEFIPEDEVGAYYSMADIVLLPHKQGYGSASGVAHQALAARKLIACSDIPKFEDIKYGVSSKIAVPPNDATAWSNLLSKLLEDTKFASTMLDKINEYADKTSKAEVAQAHMRLYESLHRGKKFDNHPLMDNKDW